MSTASPRHICSDRFIIHSGPLNFSTSFLFHSTGANLANFQGNHLGWKLIDCTSLYKTKYCRVWENFLTRFHTTPFQSKQGGGFGCACFKLWISFWLGASIGYPSLWFWAFKFSNYLRIHYSEEFHLLKMDVNLPELCLSRKRSPEKNINAMANVDIPGHGREPGHPLVCDAEPGQFFPPLAGAGLVHVLVRVWWPPPHVLEQADHLLQALQPPLTGQKKTWMFLSKEG